MLHLIPAPLHRQLYRIADWARRKWWRVRKPRRASVNMLAYDGEGRVLLVRHSYGVQHWTLPGGGVGRREDPRIAAQRELYEELACGLADMEPLLTRDEWDAELPTRPLIFSGRLVGTPSADMREIVAARMFASDKLPADLSPWAKRRIALWRELQQGELG